MSNKQSKKPWLTISLLLLTFSTIFYLIIQWISLQVFSTSSTESPPAQTTFSNSSKQSPPLNNDKAEQMPSTAIELQHSNDESINTLSSDELPVLTQLVRPDWRIEGKLSQQIDDLARSFEQGDVKAGYILAMNLRYCWRAPYDKNDFDTRIKSVEDYSDADLSIRRLKSQYEKCQGVDSAQRQQFFDVMKATAEHGYVPAQESYAQMPAEFYMTSQGHKKLPRDEYITKRDNFITEKLGFLSQAAEHGSLKAMAKLAGMYNSQNYGGKGWIKAYAYNHAILTFTDDNTLYRRYQWYNEKLSKSMNAEEIAQAQTLSAQLTAQVNANGTLFDIR